jgi:hypothetical protein
MSDEHWFAILGPVARPAPTGVIATPHDRTRSLQRAYAIGTWVVRPGERMLTEYVRPEPHSLFGALQLISWPIIVEGPGADLQHPGVLGRLHRLATMLALTWNEPWQVRSAPANAKQMPAMVPDSWPAPPESFGFREVDQWREGVPLPELVVRHWEGLSAKHALSDALSTWHQGLMVQELHPSLAQVAFTAAIDALRPKDLSSGEHLRRTIEIHAPSDVIERLRKEDPYGRRSRTVHSSRLHHFEQRFGITAEFDPDHEEAGERSLGQLMGHVSVVREIARLTLVAAIEATADSGEMSRRYP